MVASRKVQSREGSEILDLTLLYEPTALALKIGNSRLASEGHASRIPWLLAGQARAFWGMETLTDLLLVVRLSRL
jgi:hypothetical protein